MPQEFNLYIYKDEKAHKFNNIWRVMETQSKAVL